LRGRHASNYSDDCSWAQAATLTALQHEDYLPTSLRAFNSGTRSGGGVADPAMSVL
jgi:cytochrome c553